MTSKALRFGTIGVVKIVNREFSQLNRQKNREKIAIFKSLPNTQKIRLKKTRFRRVFNRDFTLRPISAVSRQKSLILKSNRSI